MQQEKRQQGKKSSRSAELRKLFEEVYKNKKSREDAFYADNDDINDDDDADCCMDWLSAKLLYCLSKLSIRKKGYD